MNIWELDLAGANIDTHLESLVTLANVIDPTQIIKKPSIKTLTRTHGLVVCLYKECQMLYGEAPQTNPG